jgi:hypothetical protein
MSSDFVSSNVSHIRKESTIKRSIPPKEFGTLQTHWLITWLLEITAAVFSILCLGSIVGLLLAIDGKPYHNWRIENFNITPNALLSILSAFSKSSLILLISEGTGQLKWVYFQQRPHRLLDLQIFDEASRGPLGALRLILSVRLKATIATLGAVVTILAIAVDPFTQQILSFPTSMMSVSNITNGIAKSRVFGGTGLSYLAWGAGPLKLPALHYMNELQGAIVAGTVGEVKPAHFSCPSGDCTWQEFSTLGFCSHCVDISARVIASQPLKVSSGKNVTYILQDQDGLGTGSLRTTINFMNLQDTQILTSIPTVAVQVGPLSLVKNTSNLGTTIINVQTLNFPFVSPWNQSAWNTLGESIRPQALNCSFTLCQQIHAEARYERGVLHDPVTSSHNLIMSGWTNSDTRLSQLKMLPAWPKGQAQPAKHSLDISHMEESDNTYWVSPADMSALVQRLDFELGTIEPYMMSLTSRISALQSSLDNKGFHGFIDFVPPMFDDIALSLTNKLRTLNATTMVQGTAREPATFVHVNWYWLIFPATLVTLSIVFLAMTIVFSNEAGGVLWKTSLLPFLFHDLQPEGQGYPGDQLRDLHHAAGRSFAMLRHGDGGKVAFSLQASDRGQDSNG